MSRIEKDESFVVIAVGIAQTRYRDTLRLNIPDLSGSVPTIRQNIRTYKTDKFSSIIILFTACRLCSEVNSSSVGSIALPPADK